MKKEVFVAIAVCGVAACGGGGGSGGGATPQGGNQGGLNSGGVNTGGATSGDVDLSEYYFPSSNKTLIYDYYEYDANDLFDSSHEADFVEEYTVTNNQVKISYDLSEELDITIHSDKISFRSTLMGSGEGPRFVDVGVAFNISEDFYDEMRCTVVEKLTSFRMMSDKQEANYPAYNDVIKVECVGTREEETSTGKVINTDFDISFYSKNNGPIGWIDYDCDKVDANGNWYLDDLDGQNCAEEYTYIEVVGPKI